MSAAGQQEVSGEATLGEIALAIAERGGRTALRQMRATLAAPGAQPEASTLSYEALGEAAIQVAQGLISLGIERGQAVCILSDTRAEWTLFELATMLAGAVLTPIYHTDSAEECAYVIEHSQARLVLCEDAAQMAKIAAIRERCPLLAHVLAIEADDAEGVLTLQALARLGAETVPAAAVRERVQQVRPDEVASIVYTSGTTGPPKGCLITHRSLVATIGAYRESLQLREEEVVLYMFLPLSHVLARIAELVVLQTGGELVYWSGDPHRIVEELAEAKPTHFVAVPRIYEKIHAAVIGRVQERGRIAELAFRWAVEVGRRARPRGRAARAGGLAHRARLGLAERIALAEVRAVFGPRLELAAVGAAPVEGRLLEFFDACGVLVIEGYGLTESCAAATLNPLRRPRFGTVGVALPGTEVAIAPDGEILIAGPHVFAGYHRDPEASAAVIRDGWLATGDLGAISPDGYLSVMGRKKDLIITSSGKNIGPAEIESALRDTRFISEAVIYGDRRPYLVAMLTIDADEAGALARQAGMGERALQEMQEGDLSAIAADERVRELLWREVQGVNERFARIEQVKRFGVLPRQLTQAEGELTPTLKVKRSIVYEKYASFFAGLYEDGGPADGSTTGPGRDGEREDGSTTGPGRDGEGRRGIGRRQTDGAPGAQG